MTVHTKRKSPLQKVSEKQMGERGVKIPVSKLSFFKSGGWEGLPLKKNSFTELEEMTLFSSRFVYR